jgi:hypothetical protein
VLISQTRFRRPPHRDGIRGRCIAGWLDSGLSARAIAVETPSIGATTAILLAEADMVFVVEERFAS